MIHALDRCRLDLIGVLLAVDASSGRAVTGTRPAQPPLALTVFELTLAVALDASGPLGIVLNGLHDAPRKYRNSAALVYQRAGITNAMFVMALTMVIAMFTLVAPGANVGRGAQCVADP